jgi:hypothetical protein
MHASNNLHLALVSEICLCSLDSLEIIASEEPTVSKLRFDQGLTIQQLRCGLWIETSLLALQVNPPNLPKMSREGSCARTMEV